MAYYIIGKRYNTDNQQIITFVYCYNTENQVSKTVIFVDGVDYVGDDIVL